MDEARAGVRFRRAIYRIHLWTGLTLGLYVLMLSVTGSALVYRLELNRWFATATPAFDPTRSVLSTAELTAAAQRAYPGYEVTYVGTRLRRHRPGIEIRLQRGPESLERLFNPYTGDDLGDAMPRVMRFLTWLAFLHDDLLLGETGRTINGVGSALVVLLLVTGAITWWPVWRRQGRGLGVRWRAGRALVHIDLHRATGFWSLGLLGVWAVSGIYFAFPEPFDDLAGALSDVGGSGVGDAFLTWITFLHFGRFIAALQPVWVVVGLLPGVLVVTGVWLWWRRQWTGFSPDAHARDTSRAMPRGRRALAGGLAGVAGIGALWLLYERANYREEQQVGRFLAALAAGQYQFAHTMWEDQEGYDTSRFLLDWGPEGRHWNGGGAPTVLDSTSYGPVVTVYVRAHEITPLALQVDKETQLISYAPFNEYSASDDSR
ncbi:MAG: PepSY-associated TM helix domain-containing protein [Vicinamibacterales bacterium]